jgi:hypothetical protein
MNLPFRCGRLKKLAGRQGLQLLSLGFCQIERMHTNSTLTLIVYQTMAPNEAVETLSQRLAPRSNGQSGSSRLLKNVARMARCKASGAQRPRHIHETHPIDRRGSEHRATPQMAHRSSFSTAC